MCLALLLKLIMINASQIYTGILIIDRFLNHSLVNLSNLNCFSHIYTPSDAHFQSKCTGNNFGANLDQYAGLRSHFNLFRDCFTNKRFPNCCLISLSNLNRFSHIYTSSDVHFQSKCTSNIFGAGIGGSAGLPSHFNLFRECFKSVYK